jgi:amino acid transporter
MLNLQRTTNNELRTINKIMLKALFVILGIGVILIYASASMFGWEFANSGSKSRFGTPFFYGGFRGGK